MNVKLLAVFSVLLIAGLSSVLVLDSEADAASLDDAPDATYTIDLGSFHLLRGSSPQVVDLIEAIDSIDGFTPHFAFPEALCNGVVDSGGLPGWITVDKSHGSTVSDATVDLVINPVYVAEPSQYWVWLDNTQNSITFLFTFEVEVEDSDPTVTPVGTFFYNVVFVTNGGSSIGPVSHDSQSSSWTIDLSNYVPVRDGYEFRGWSPDPSCQSIFGSTLTIDGVKGEVVTVKVYAVWEESHLVIPTFWDGLIELFSNPIILLISLILFLAVCLFIRNRLGGYA